MPSPIDPSAFGFIVGDLSRLLKAEMERRIAAAGLSVTPGEGRTLAHVARLGAVRQNVLAERIGVEAMTLSGYLDRLEARGLVAREPDPTDRRAKLVHLTEAAAGVLGEIGDIGASLKADLSTALPAGEWARLIADLAGVRDRLVAIKCDAGRREGRAA